MITSFFAPKRKRKSPEDTDTTVTEMSTSTSSSKSTASSDSTNDTASCTPTKAAEKRAKSGLVSSTSSGNNMSWNRPNSSLSITENVRELVSTLTEESWKEALKKYFEKPSFASLASFVKKERKQQEVYPPPQDTFTALNLVPLDKVKVVIVGQDPYHGPGQGHGLAFSVRKGVTIPPSLKNIYKELLENPNCGLNKMPNHGCLERWARQGVLLLNTVLTVRRGEANSHKNRGWEDFTDEVIRCLFTKRKRTSSEGCEEGAAGAGAGIVFLLWGAPASKKAESILKKCKGMGVKTVVLCSSHPSPLGAHKTASPFMGSKCFAKANEALRSMGLLEIDWGVDGTLMSPVEHQMGTMHSNDHVEIKQQVMMVKDKERIEDEEKEEIVVNV